tara:strand:- start:28 stop:210 length:183 start_codon:yes stop_codon:yes gene_type:complete
MSPTLSKEQLLDISLAYSSEEILEVLGIETLELAQMLQERIEENLYKFNLRPVDCDIHDF